MTRASGAQSSNPDHPMTPSTGGNPILLCLSDNHNDDDNSYDANESSLMMDDKDVI